MDYLFEIGSIGEDIGQFIPWLKRPLLEIEQFVFYVFHFGLVLVDIGCEFIQRELMSADVVQWPWFFVPDHLFQFVH